MGKIKDRMKELGQKLKGFPKNKQSKAFVRVIQFFAIMLVLTIFAKGAAGVSMPVVKVTSPSQQNIVNSSEYQGNVVAANKVDIKLPAGLKVGQVYVSPGKTVKEGDDLLLLDTGKLEELQTQQQLDLQKMRIDLLELQKAQAQDDSAVQDAIEAQRSAQQAYDRARQDNENNLELKMLQEQTDIAKFYMDRAYEAYIKAEQEYEAAESGAQSQGSSVAESSSSAVEPGSSSASSSSESPDVYNKRVARDAAFAEWQTRKTAYEEDYKKLQEMKTTISRQMEDSRKALDKANKALAEAYEKFNEQTPKFNLEQRQRQLQIEQTQQKIADQQKLIDDLQKVVAFGGVVKATTGGVVTEISVTTGAVTTDTDKVRISTGAEGYIVEFSVPQDKAREIKMDAMVSVKLGNYYWGSEARIVGRSMPNESGMITMKAKLSSGEWNEGDSVKVTLVASDKTYWTCVPVEAVRPEGKGFYVLVLKEEATIIGTQTVARKIEVKVQDKDSKYAAIEFVDAVDSDREIRVIVSGSKPVSDGDMVRQDEAGTGGDKSNG